MKRFLICVFSILCAASFAIAQNQYTKHDGDWWLKLTEAQKDEFVAGLADCYTSHVGGDHRFEIPSKIAAERITTFYGNHPKHYQTRVVFVLDRLSQEGALLWPTPQPRGEVFGEKHSYFDREYWEEMNNAGRVAYVDGYLECRVTYTRAVVPLPNEFYVEKISERVGLTGDRSHRAVPSGTPGKIGDIIDELLR